LELGTWYLKLCSARRCVRHLKSEMRGTSLRVPRLASLRCTSNSPGMPEKKYQPKPKAAEPPLAEQMSVWKAEDRTKEKWRDDFLMSIGAGKPLASEKVMRRLQKA
jgi:hypothetical protein